MNSLKAKTGILIFMSFSDVHFNLISSGFNLALHEPTPHEIILIISGGITERQRVTKVISIPDMRILLMFYSLFKREEILLV